MLRTLWKPIRTAVVTGASGFIGTRLVRKLCADGVKVRALDIEAPRERLGDVDYVLADVRRPLDVELGRGADVIFNLAAIHRTPGHPAHAYYDTNVLGALEVVRLAERTNVPSIVFTSSISVYGPSESLMTEASPLQPVSGYGHSKRQAEEIHNAWQERGQGRQLIVVRPAVIFGPGERGNYTFLANALKKGYFFYPGRSDTVKSGGYVDELIRGITFALGEGGSRVLFNFSYPEQSTMAEVVNAFEVALGRRLRPPTIPLAPMMAAAGIFEAISALGLKTPVHRERILKLVQSTRIAPRWLLDNGYQFDSNLLTALKSWRDETSGRFT